VVKAEKKVGLLTRLILVIWMGGGVLFCALGGAAYVQESYKEQILKEGTTWAND
jgi:hypothetical protein